MVLGKYHVVIFKEKTGKSWNFKFRGGFGVTLVLFMIALSAGNFWLYKQSSKDRLLSSQLQNTSAIIDEQSSQMTDLARQISEMQENLQRVQYFDSKLRTMMNMNQEISNEGMGGNEAEIFSQTYLPLHKHELMARKMNSFLKELATDIHLEEVRQQELLTQVRTQREMLASYPSTWPVEGYLTSRFGMRQSPFSGKRIMHKGLDIAASTGTPIHAPGKGVVVFSGPDGAYGNSVVVQHGSGITTHYAHMHRIAVKEGQVLKRGEMIGSVGNTGRSTGPHLHYEVRLNGVHVDPLDYIFN